MAEAAAAVLLAALISTVLEELTRAAGQRSALAAHGVRTGLYNRTIAAVTCGDLYERLNQLLRGLVVHNVMLEYDDQLHALVQIDERLWDAYCNLRDLLEEANYLRHHNSPGPMQRLRAVRYGPSMRAACAQLQEYDMQSKLRTIQQEWRAYMDQRRRDRLDALPAGLAEWVCEHATGDLRGCSSLTIPSIPGPFVDSSGHLDLLAQRSQAHKYVGIVGMAGSGKTALAAQFCNERAGGREVIFLPVGRLCQDFMQRNRSDHTSELLRDAFVKLFPGFAPPDPRHMNDSRVCMVMMRDLRAQQRPVLLVLDGVKQQEDIDALDFVSGTHVLSRVIITTQHEHVLHRRDCTSLRDQLEVLQMQSLPDGDAYTLLRAHAPRGGAAPPLGVGSGSIAQIARDCGGLPGTVLNVARALAAHGRDGGDDATVEWIRMLQNLQAMTCEQERFVVQACRPAYAALPAGLKECARDLSAFPHDRVCGRDLVALFSTHTPLPYNGAENRAERKLEDLVRRGFLRIELDANDSGRVFYSVPRAMWQLLVAEARAYAGAPAFVYRGRYRGDGAVGGQPHTNARLMSVRWHPKLAIRSRLRTLVLDGSAFEKLPEAIAQCKYLRFLSLNTCKSVRKLPAFMGELWLLNVILVRGCAALENVHEDIGKLPALRCIDLENCPALQQLPDSVIGLMHAGVVKGIF